MIRLRPPPSRCEHLASGRRGECNYSKLYAGFWREFKAQGIEIPYPQCEVRFSGGKPPAQPA